jgi:hypothetical protein
MDARLLNEAIAFAKANESKAPRDLELNHYLSFGREPYGEAVGPFKTRGDMTGIVVRHGYIVAEWGEPNRVDMTFSVTKSFLSTTVGLALDHGLIRGVNDRVQPYMPNSHFDSGHNAKVTWNHLLRQTSDWEGTLWGKPDWADRPPSDPITPEYVTRAQHEQVARRRPGIRPTRSLGGRSRPALLPGSGSRRDRASVPADLPGVEHHPGSNGGRSRQPPAVEQPLEFELVYRGRSS